MDEIVQRALAKWPRVPHCTGWLLLDRRGIWRMRDATEQALGTAGQPIQHEALIKFICRNYSVDEQGQCFFQNGPQRVYVELAYAPWVVRLLERAGTLTLTDHTGQPFTPSACWLDEAGNVLFEDNSQPARIALLHDHDLALLTEHTNLTEQANQPNCGVSSIHPAVLHWNINSRLLLGTIQAANIPKRFGFIASPAKQRQVSGEFFRN